MTSTAASRSGFMPMRATRSLARSESIFAATRTSLATATETWQRGLHADWEEQIAEGHYTTRGHTKPVHCVDVSSDMDYVVTGSNDGTMRVWSYDDASGAFKLMGVLSEEGEVTAVAVAELEAIALAGTDFGDFFVVSWSNLKPMAVEVKRHLHNGAITATSFLDHSTAVQGDDDLFSEMSYGRGHKLKGVQRTVKFLATGGEDGFVNLMALRGLARDRNHSLRILQRLPQNDRVLHMRSLDPIEATASLAVCTSRHILLWSLAGSLLMKITPPQGSTWTGFAVTFQLCRDCHRNRNSITGWHSDDDLESGCCCGDVDMDTGQDRCWPAPESLLLGVSTAQSGSGDNKLCVWSLSEMGSQMHEAVQLPTTTPEPIVQYQDDDVRKAELSLDNSFYVLLREGSSRCWARRLAPDKRKETHRRQSQLEDPSPLVSPGIKDHGVVLPHPAAVTCMKLSEDPDGCVLASGCENGNVYIWDLDGDDAGEMTVEIRSLTRTEVYLPFIMFVVSFSQVFSFAFGPAIPWDAELKANTEVIVNIVIFNWEYLLMLPKEAIFWPQAYSLLAAMMLFILLALNDVDAQIDRLNFRVGRRVKRLRKRQHCCARCTEVLFAVTSCISFLVDIFMRVCSTVLVVQMTRQVVRAIDCVPKADGSGTFVASAPSVTCWEGHHWSLVRVLLPVYCLYFMMVMPFAVVQGDMRYVQPSEFLSPVAWRKNAQRKATVLHTGALHPRREHVFVTAITEFIVKSALPAVSVLTTKYPTAQMLLICCIGTAWLVITCRHPPIVEPAFNTMVMGGRVLILCSMICGLITTQTSPDGWTHDVPLVLLSFSSLIVPCGTLTVMMEASTHERIQVVRLHGREAPRMEEMEEEVLITAVTRPDDGLRAKLRSSVGEVYGMEVTCRRPPTPQKGSPGGLAPGGKVSACHPLARTGSRMSCPFPAAPGKSPVQKPVFAPHNVLEALHQAQAASSGSRTERDVEMAPAEPDPEPAGFAKALSIDSALSTMAPTPFLGDGSLTLLRALTPPTLGTPRSVSPLLSQSITPRSCTPPSRSPRLLPKELRVPLNTVTYIP